MKKVLFASTALVAAGLMTATTASASEKIKLELGGFSKWWVVGQFNQDSYTRAAGVDYNSVDIKGDNEIHFGGSTTLDNGMIAGVQVTLEGGGNGANDNIIDHSFAFLETGYGKFIIGATDNGTKLLHVSAPDAAGNIGSDGILTGGFAIAEPTNFQSRMVTTAIDTDGTAEKITYVAPTFMGLTLGASYIPNAAAHNRGLVNLTAQNVGEIYGVGGLYANTFNDVDFKLSGGWVTYDMNTVAIGVSPTARSTDVNEWSTGLQVGYAGFTVGGSYRKVDAADALRANDGHAWDAGVQYANGPYAVSLYYFRSQREGAVTAGDDEFTVYQLSGSYNLGAGVDVLASVGHAKYDGETNLANENNKGWAVMTGLGLSF